MATGGTPNRLSLDTASFERQIDRVVNRFRQYNQELIAVAAASSRFNEQGRLVEVTMNSVTEFGKVVVSTLQRVNGQWEQSTRVINRSVAQQLRDQRRLAAETQKQQQQGKNYQETLAFRPRLDAEAKTLPTSANALDRRFFTNAQRDLERFVARGAVTAKDAIKILDDIQAGVTTRLKGVEEDFRVAALRMFTQQRNLHRAARAGIERENARQDSTKVKGFLESMLGPLAPGASQAVISSVQGSMNRLASIVQSQGVESFQKFKDVASYALLGIAQPTNDAERYIVRMVSELKRQYASARKATDDLTSAQQRLAASTKLGDDLRQRLGRAYNRLNPLDRERVDAQINRIENLRNRRNDPLTDAGAQRAINAGLTGAGAQGFTGVEAQARRSAARIRAIIRGELKDPFEINLAIAQNFNFIKGILTGRLVTGLVRDFEQVVDAAAQYQRSIALIQTITDDVRVPFDKWSDSIRQVSDELGKPIADVAAAGYDVLSNQVTKNVEDTKAVLRVAGEFAKVTNSTTEDSVNLLSSAINTFKLSSSDAERVMSQFFTTIDLGRVKTGEMADTIGRSAVFAKTLGVSLEELQAGIITITQTGQKADSSFTLLNNVFQKLLNPTKELQAWYDKIGVSTGDVFVKTFGFAGALKKLGQETGGSASKMAEFFNEIRAFSGVDALISRAEVFEDALKQLGKSSETFDAAKKKFEDLPGQRFIVEMNKLKNLFLTTLQTNVLTTIVKITDAFGGLSNVIKDVTIVGVGLGTVLGGSFIVSRVTPYVQAVFAARDAMAALTGATAAFSSAQALAFGGGVVAIGALAAVAYSYYQASLDYYDKLKAANDQRIETEVANNERASSDRIAILTKGLNAEQSVLLQSLAINKQVANERVRVEEEAGKRISESLKNAFESGYSTARNILDELKNKQRDLLRSADDFTKSGVEKARDKLSQDQFRYSLKKNDVNFGGDPVREREIYRKRLQELNKFAMEAARKGNREAATRFLDEKDQIVSEMAQKTRRVGGTNRDGSGRGSREVLRYSDGEAFLLKSAQYRLQVEKQLTIEQRKQAANLQETINKEADRLRALEDAFKAYYDFKLTDNGKAIDVNKDAALARLDKLRANALAQSRDFLKSAGGTDPFLQRDLFSKQTDLAFGRGQEFRDNIVRQFDAKTVIDEQNNLTQKAIDKMGDDAAARIKNAEDKVVFAQNTMSRSVGDAQTRLTNIFDRNVLSVDPGLRTPDPTSAISRLLDSKDSLKRIEIQGDISTAIKNNNFDLAIQKLDELVKLMEKYKALESTVPGPNGGQSVAIGDELRKAREELLTARYSQANVAQAQQEMSGEQSNLGQVHSAISQLDASYKALGNTDTEVVNRLIQDQDRAAQAFRQTRDAVQEVVNTINRIGSTSTEEAARKVQSALPQSFNSFTPGAVTSPGGDVEVRGSGRFIPQVNQLNGPSSPVIQQRTNNDTFNINVNVQAAPSLQQTGKAITDSIKRELRRDPQLLQRPQ